MKNSEPNDTEQTDFDELKEQSGAGQSGGSLTLKEFLECKQCELPYSNKDVKRFPRLLKCGHSFCSQCLDEVLDGSQLVCRICEEVTLVGKNGVKSLGTNLPLLESIHLSNVSNGHNYGSGSSGDSDYWTDEDDDEGWSALYCPQRSSNECEICLTPFNSDTHSREENPSSAHSICQSCLAKIQNHHLDEAEWIMPADPPPAGNCFEMNGDRTAELLSTVREGVSSGTTEKLTAGKCAKEALTATAATQFATKTIEESVTKAVPYFDFQLLRGFTRSVTTNVVTTASKKVIFASSGGAAAMCDFGIASAQDLYRWSNGKPTKGVSTNAKNATWTGVCAGTGFVLAGPVGAFVGGMLAPKSE